MKIKCKKLLKCMNQSIMYVLYLKELSLKLGKCKINYKYSGRYKADKKGC